MADDEEYLHHLQRKWAGRWKIWRSRRPGDVEDERTGDYYASRLDETAGVFPTIGRASPFLLDDALENQRAAVEEGAKPLDVGLDVRPGQ